MKSLSLLLPVLLFSFSTFGQNTDTLQASQWLQEAIAINANEDLEKEGAIHLAQKALAIFEKNSFNDRIGACHETLANAYFDANQYPEAIASYSLAIDAYTKNDGTHSEKIVKLYDALASVHYKNKSYKQLDSVLNVAFGLVDQAKISNPILADLYEIKAVALMVQVNYDSSLLFYEKALKLHRQEDTTSRKTILALADNYYNQSTVYHRKGLYAKVTPLVKKAIEYAKKGESDEHLASFYSGLGLNYNKLGDLERAIDTYNKGIALTLKLPHGATSSRLSRFYNNLGVVYRKSGNCSKAAENYKKAIAIDKKLHQGKTTPFQADILTNIGACHLDKGELDIAERYFLEALAIRQELLPPMHPRLGINNAALGLVAQDKEDYAEAIKYFEKANEIYISIFGEQHLRPANGFMSIAFCHYKLGQLDKAIEFYQKALDSNNYHQDAENRFNLVLAENVLFTCLKEISRTYYELYESSQDAEKLALSKTYMEESIAATQFYKANFQSPASKKRLMARSYENYVNLIFLNHTYYEKTEDKGYIEQAFTTAEAAKSNYLLEHLNDWSAQFHAAIPDTLLDQAIALESSIAQLEKTQFEATSNKNDSLLQATNIELFDQKESYGQLKNELLETYPEYAKLKYFQSNPGLDKVQQELTSNQALIEYVVGENHLYTFLITSEKVEFFFEEIDTSFFNQINDLRESLYQYWLLPAENRSPEMLQQSSVAYSENAHGLFNTLLGPLGELPTQLIIVPSKSLGYIPFEVLLTERPKNPMQYKDLPYLIHKHRISYNFSAALWQEMRSKSTEAFDVNLIAPTFEGNQEYITAVEYRRDNLGLLLFNTDEVQGIQEIIGGNTWVGATATKAQFLEIAENSKILHFATHAKLDDRDQDYSYLSFSSTTDSLVADKLYIRELYAQKIPVEMVVLSACETGVGEIQEGEGIISLARGFAYAGASSIVTSLWAVNDQSTARIMTDFYTKLNDGQEKDEALRSAKLAYLENASDQLEAHPFKWAPFIVIGNTSKIDFSNQGKLLNTRNIIFGLILLIGVGFFLFRRQSSARTA